MEDHKKKLIAYFKKNLGKGYDSNTLKFALVKQGYSRILVEDALEKANMETAEKVPVLKEKPRIRYEIIDEYDQPITIKKPWWKRMLGE